MIPGVSEAFSANLVQASSWRTWIRNYPENSEKSPGFSERAAKSGALGAREAGFDPLEAADDTDGELAIVLAAWSDLSRSAKDAVLRIVAQEGRRS